MHSHTLILIYIHTYIHTHFHTYTHALTHINTYVHTYIHTHLYTQTHLHSYTLWVNSWFCLLLADVTGFPSQNFCALIWTVDSAYYHRPYKNSTQDRGSAQGHLCHTKWCPFWRYTQSSESVGAFLFLDWPQPGTLSPISPRTSKYSGTLWRFPMNLCRKTEDNKKVGNISGQLGKLRTLFPAQLMWTVRPSRSSCKRTIPLRSFLCPFPRNTKS